MLPQPVIDWLLRPSIHGLSRILWRMRWRHTEHVPRRGGVVIACNHQTYLDPFWISVPIRRPVRYLTWDAAFDWAIVGPLMGMVGAWPLRQEGADASAIRRSLDWLAQGGAIVIFPEGGRGRPDGSAMEFKEGAARLALAARVPILPVTIRGGHRAWHRDQRLPRPAPVEILYHPLIEVARRPGESVRGAAHRETARLTGIITGQITEPG